MQISIHDWTIYPLGDHAFVFALDEKINPSIVKKITRLNAFLVSKKIACILDIIPSYHTLTIVYDLIEFTTSKEDIHQQIFTFAKNILDAFETIKTSSAIEKNELIKVPVCYDLPFALDLENLSITKQLSVEEIIQIHTAKIYEIYSIGFLPGFAYMGIVDERISMSRHDKPRAQVLPGSVGIAGLQTGIYPSTSPGGWQIIGRTPWKTFDNNELQLAKFKVGDLIQFYSITKTEFEKMNEHNL